MSTAAKPLLLLASSRSDGNTARLARAMFAEGIVDFVDLANLSIGYYDYDARSAGDDFLPLMQRIVQAPLLVLATPLYWYTMSAQAKTFIDRLSDLLEGHKELGRSLRGLPMAVICSGSDPIPPPSFDEPFRLTCTYLGMRYLGSHYARLDGGRYTSSTAEEDVARFGAQLTTGY
jgi:NAD(P)H-dependent FMN reductase